MKDRKGHKGKRLAHEKVSDAELRRIVKDQTWSHGQTQHGNLARDLLATRRAMRKAIRMLDTSNGFLATHGTREVNYVLTRALGARSKHGR